MTGLDASMLYSETATAHMHTMKVAVLDVTGELGLLDRSRLVDEFGQRLHLLPSLLRRPVRVPFDLHHPVWVNDPDFLVSRHVKELTLPAPGRRAELDAALAEIHGQPLNLERPLWEMTFITGLETGQIAVAVKIHHAVADGMAAAAGLVAVAASGPDETVAGPQTEWTPEPLPRHATLIREAVADRIRELRFLPGLLTRTLAGVRRMLRARRRLDHRPPPPMSGAKAPWNGRLSSRRTVATARLPLADFKRVKAAFGCSLNDVLLAVAAGGLCRSAAREGFTLDKPLVTAIPSSIDAPGAPPRLSGNHVTQFFSSLCTDIDDPVERLAAISQVTRNARSLNSEIGRELMRDWNLFAYRWAYQLVWKHVMPRLPTPAINVVISNVPGPPEPSWFAGARMDELYSLSVLTEGAGLNLTAWSYADCLYVGIVSCPELVSDIRAMADDVASALEELLERAALVEQAA
ncbi:MAG TPA: wax ester/triacylglycerol synthase family O-acyltransferase [Frankiaceae bacterium]|nr:wax ester/triacylglycerol synthase family O-acyltransferase [Frankiaceae bacterium]